MNESGGPRPWPFSPLGFRGVDLAGRLHLDKWWRCNFGGEATVNGGKQVPEMKRVYDCKAEGDVCLLGGVVRRSGWHGFVVFAPWGAAMFAVDLKKFVPLHREQKPTM